MAIKTLQLEIRGRHTLKIERRTDNSALDTGIFMLTSTFAVLSWTPLKNAIIKSGLERRENINKFHSLHFYSRYCIKIGLLKDDIDYGDIIRDLICIYDDNLGIEDLLYIV
jgi:hypothetical protein